MSFFPPDPEMPEFDDAPAVRSPWWTAPTDRLPVLYPASEILATTEHLAIALVGVDVYSDGVEIRIERRLRRNDLPYDEWQRLNNAFMEHWAGHGASSAGRLRYGVVLSTGEQVLSDRPFGFAGDPMSPPESSSLVRSGGGGGGDGHSYSSNDALWLWPLPPSGSLELVLQWPTLGVPETRTSLDVSSFGELAEQSIPFWP